MSFNKHTDKIAITIPRFSIKQRLDGRFRKYSQPYIVTLAVDSNGVNNPELHINTGIFPNVRKGDTVTMLGQGLLVYGPENPGEFVAVSVLLMESDKGIQKLGSRLEDVVASKVAQTGLKALLAAGASAYLIGKAIGELAELVAQVLKSNEDDYVLRTSGTFLRDMAVPYDVNRKFHRANAKAEMEVQVIPLQVSNGQGTSTAKLAL